MSKYDSNFFNEEAHMNNEANKESIPLRTLPAAPKLDQKANMYKLVLLALTFLLLYCADNAFNTMISQMYYQMGYSSLGNITLIAMCFSLALSSILAPYAAKFFSFKATMFFCSLFFSVLQLMGAFTSFCDTDQGFPLCKQGLIHFLNIFCALLKGASVNILWICQCGYTTNLCDENHKSLFFGAFSCIFQLSILVGALFTATILKIFENQLLFFCLCIFISLTSAFAFVFLPHVEIRDFIQDSEFKQKAKEFLSLFIKREKISISGISLFCGLEMGFWVGNLFRFVEMTLEERLNNAEINVYTAWVFACLGFFEILGGAIATLLGDKLSKYTLVTFANILIFVAFGFSILLVFQKKYYLCFVIAGFLGTGDCVLQIMLNAIVSTTKGNNILDFSHYVFIQNMGVVISIVLGLNLDPFTDIFFLIVAQIVLYLIAMLFKH